MLGILTNRDAIVLSKSLSNLIERHWVIFDTKFSSGITIGDFKNLALKMDSTVIFEAGPFFSAIYFSTTTHAFMNI